jgi:hypothetical protein
MHGMNTKKKKRTEYYSKSFSTELSRGWLRHILIRFVISSAILRLSISPLHALEGNCQENNDFRTVKYDQCPATADL